MLELAERGARAGTSSAALHVYLDHQLDTELRQFARRHELPLGRVVRRALRDWLRGPSCRCGCGHKPAEGDR
jgi:hypothetical protein